MEYFRDFVTGVEYEVVVFNLLEWRVLRNPSGLDFGVDFKIEN